MEEQDPGKVYAALPAGMDRFFPGCIRCFADKGNRGESVVMQIDNGISGKPAVTEKRHIISAATEGKPLQSDPGCTGIKPGKGSHNRHFRNEIFLFLFRDVEYFAGVAVVIIFPWFGKSFADIGKIKLL